MCNPCFIVSLYVCYEIYDSYIDPGGAPEPCSAGKRELANSVLFVVSIPFSI